MNYFQQTEKEMGNNRTMVPTYIPQSSTEQENDNLHSIVIDGSFVTNHWRRNKDVCVKH